MAIQTAEQRAEAKEAKDLAIKLARLAVVDYFEEAYGNDISKIEALQQLCRDVGVDVGPTIIQCKKVNQVPSPLTIPVLISAELEGDLHQHRRFRSRQEGG